MLELDEDLRPKSILYRPTIGGDEPEHVHVHCLRSTSKTIGLVVSRELGAALQVCSRDGELLNEVPLGLSGRAHGEQLIVLGDGYLFSDRQLSWVGCQPNQAWQFGPPLSRTSTDRWGDRWRYFGAPKVMAGKLYVISLNGRLLVFDPLRIQ